jgi:hypothetical protein
VVKSRTCLPPAGWQPSLLAASLLGAAALSVAAPSAAGPGDAQGAKGLTFARRRDCVKAVPLLVEAERQRHKPSWAIALADCYLAIGELVRAGEIYHRVASDKPERGWLRADQNAAKAAKRKAAEVDARIPTLRLRTPSAYEGLQVEVDGKRIDDLDAELRLAPDEAVSVTARAKGRKDFADKVVLNEGERRVLVLRLEPASGVKTPPRPRGTPGTPVAARPTSWLGARYYGVVLPKFVMNLIADGGTTLVVPGGAFTFTTLASDIELTVALGYLSYRMGETPLKPRGEPDTQWELVGSSLQALTATVDLMWAFPLDAAKNVSFRVGGAVGLGWMFLGDMTRLHIYPANGVPGDPSTYLVCKGPNDPRGTFAYCNTLDKSANHYPGYTEPDWFHGGIRPALFPWLVVPQLGLSFHPSRATAIDVETGVSISGFLTSLGFRVGL